jgi:hypothetical protein
MLHHGVHEELMGVTKDDWWFCGTTPSSPEKSIQHNGSQQSAALQYHVHLQGNVSLTK